jgi:hypothetical protein
MKYFWNFIAFRTSAVHTNQKMGKKFFLYKFGKMSLIEKNELHNNLIPFMFDSIVLHLKEITINLSLNVKINNEKRSALYDLISLFFCRKSKPFNDQHH